MAPTVFQYGSWTEFRATLAVYASRPRSRREQLIFRGHTKSTWSLETTLDRQIPTSGDDQRERLVKSLLGEFKREAMRAGIDATKLPDDDAIDLLARHHGLPSPLLDWSASPYIAAFFAFEDAEKSQIEPVSVWMLDKAKLLAPALDVLDIIDDDRLLRFNVRALRQRGVFLRVKSIKQPLAQSLGQALSRFDIPASDRGLAMADLDEMGINPTMLFDDLAGAARSARLRIME